MNQQIGELITIGTSMSEPSEFTKRLWEYREKKRIERIKETGLCGYCPCCGEPLYVGKEEEHDQSCIWYKGER